MNLRYSDSFDVFTISFGFGVLLERNKKSPAYGWHWISWPMRVTAVWAQIKHNKAILRYNNFWSASPAHFWMYYKKKLFWNQHTIKFNIGGLQKCKTISSIYTKSNFLKHYVKKLKKNITKLNIQYCTPHIKKLFFDYFGCTFKNKLGPHFWIFYLGCHMYDLPIWTQLLAIKGFYRMF